jgi:hypothetical protein
MLLSITLLVLIVVISGAVWYSRKHVKINIEPLTNKEKNSTTKPVSTKEALMKIEKRRDITKGPLNLTDNFDLYQDIIIEYDKWAGYEMLEILGDPDNIDKNMVDFNKLAQFKLGLKDIMMFLDKT